MSDSLKRSTNMSTLEFVDGLTINFKLLPSYIEFNRDKFLLPFDEIICKKILEKDIIKHQESVRRLKIIISSGVNGPCGIHSVLKHRQKIKSNSMNIGRFYSDYADNLLTLDKVVKHTVFKSMGYKDIDMVGSHASIAVSLCELNNIPCEYIKEYLTNRDKIVSHLCEVYNPKDGPLTKTNIKFLFNIILYGGNFDTWREKTEGGDDGNSYNEPELKDKFTLKTDIIDNFICKFEEECINLRGKIIDANYYLYNEVKAKEADKGKSNRTFMSYYYQIFENHILYLSFDYLRTKRVINSNNNVHIVGLEYDGLCLPPTNPDKCTQIDQDILNGLNNRLFDLTGLKYVKMALKGYDCANDVVIEEVIKEKTDFSYEKIKKDFEYGDIQHFIVRGDGIFIKHYENKIKHPGKFSNIKICTEASLKVSYKDKIYISPSRLEESFIRKWLSDSNKRSYENMGYYPNPNTCPDVNFNLWTPYEMESVQDYTPNTDNLIFIRNHIKMLCNDDIKVFNYFELWIAHMIQFPEKKTAVCPILISKPGAGKTTLIELLTKMFGHSKVFSSTNPSNDIMGNFNKIIANRILIVLSEVSKSDTSGSMDAFKALITDESLSITGKNVDTVESENYLNFIICTNHFNPVSIDNNDRRFFVIMASNKYCKGHKDYHIKSHKIIEDINSVKTIYEYYKSLPNVDKFSPADIPETAHSKLLKESERNPVFIFIDELIEKERECVDNGYLTWISNKDLMIHWKKFAEVNNYTSKEHNYSIRALNGLIYSNDEFDDYITQYKTKSELCMVINLARIMDENKLKNNLITSDQLHKKYDNWKSTFKTLNYTKYELYLTNYNYE
jgi:hypothetical protein